MEKEKAMNYIKKLQELNKECADKIVKSSLAIDSTLLYLESGKFRCGDNLDGYVNITDMHHRLREISSLLEE